MLEQPGIEVGSRITQEHYEELEREFKVLQRQLEIFQELSLARTAMLQQVAIAVHPQAYSDEAPVVRIDDLLPKLKVMWEHLEKLDSEEYLQLIDKLQDIANTPPA